MRFLALVFVIAAVTLVAVAAQAAPHGGVIVYSARYYLPPGSKGESHFHIYRINADGTGREQITSGTTDDEIPYVSPDGKWIAFIRDNGEVCLVRAGGGSVRVLIQTSEGSTEDIDECQWLDSTHFAIVESSWSKATNYDEYELDVYDTTSGTKTAKLPGVDHIAVSSGARRVEVQDSKSSHLATVSANGSVKLGKALDITDASAEWLGATNWLIYGPNGDAATGKLFELNADDGRRQTIPLTLGYRPQPDAPTPTDGARSVLVTQGLPAGHVMIAVDDSNSTVRPNFDIYSCDLATGVCKPFLTGEQFLTCDPFGQMYATAPGRNLANYGNEKDSAGQPRTVWVAPLEVGNAGSKAPKTISGGLVWVTGADWLP